MLNGYFGSDLLIPGGDSPHLGARITMGSARDFLSSSVADAILPALRRPFEDVVYETLDNRQVPTRTDFKELRDQVNSLRGQITGATGGAGRVAEQVEALEERLDALSARIDALSGGLDAAINAQIDRRIDKVTEQVAKRLGARLDRLETHLSEAWLNARLLRSREDLVAELGPRIDARAERALVDARLKDLLGQLNAAVAANAALAARVEALERAPQATAPAEAAAPEAAAPEAAPEAAPAPAASAEPAPAPEADRAGCKVPGCEDPIRSKGFCARHYQKWRRGSLEGFPFEG